MRIVVAALLLWPALAAADVIYHSHPPGYGVTKEVRREIARSVREHVLAAGHRLGPKRRAKHLLATEIAVDRGQYVVVVRFHAKSEKKPKQFVGTARREELLGMLAEFLEQVLPRKSRGELPAPPPPEPAAETPAAAVTSTWVEDQPQWPDLYQPPEKLAPFPGATDPPPKIGEIKRR
jgi:hypothetical protein